MVVPATTSGATTSEDDDDMNAVQAGTLEAPVEVKLINEGVYTYVSLEGPAVDAVANFALKKCSGTSGGGIDIPPVYVANRIARDKTNRHHVTLVTPPEMDELREKYGMDPNAVFSRILEEMDPGGDAWVPLGFGRVRAPLGDGGSGGGGSGGGAALEAEALFLLVAWPAGRAVRAALGLTQEQHFHITLGFNPSDIYHLPKDLTTLVGARVDPRLVSELAAAAESAGAMLPAHQRAAVLVLRALTELDLTSDNVANREVTTPQAATAATAAAATSPSQSSSPSSPSLASAPGFAASASSHRTLTASSVDSLHSLLSLALDWTRPPADDELLHNQQQEGGRDEGPVRQVVAACARMAWARLAGQCGEQEKVAEHVRQAEALLLDLDLKGRCTAAAAAAAAFEGLGASVVAAAVEGLGASVVVAAGPAVALAAATVAAAAECLEGKALRLLERFVEAARGQ